METIEFDLILERTDIMFLSISGILCHFLSVNYYFFLVSQNLVKISGKSMIVSVLTT